MRPRTRDRFATGDEVVAEGNQVREAETAGQLTEHDGREITLNPSNTSAGSSASVSCQATPLLIDPRPGFTTVRWTGPRSRPLGSGAPRTIAAVAWLKIPRSGRTGSSARARSTMSRTGTGLRTPVNGRSRSAARNRDGVAPRDSAEAVENGTSPSSGGRMPRAVIHRCSPRRPDHHTCARHLCIQQLQPLLGRISMSSPVGIENAHFAGARQCQPAEVAFSARWWVGAGKETVAGGRASGWGWGGQQGRASGCSLRVSREPGGRRAPERGRAPP